MALNQLAEAGVASRLTDEASAGMLTHLGNVSVGILIAQADAPLAKKVLANHVRSKQDDDEQSMEPREALRRAWLSAIIGIFMFPLSFYSIWLLTRHRLLSKEAPGGNRRAMVTLALDLFGIVVGTVFVIDGFMTTFGE